MAKKSIIVLADGFEEMEAITPIDLLRRAGVTVTVLGLDSLDIRGAHDIYVCADNLLEEYEEEPDALVLPGGMPGTTNLAASQTILSMVREYHSRGSLCAAICAAPTVFSKAGILTGKRFTCFPGTEAKITEGVFCEDQVVIDGNIITSRGAGTAIPFSLELIAYLVGRKTAQEVAGKIVYK